ncbi:MAG: hypothetical protein ACREC9_04040 [Methylocella sp.]
MIAQGLRRPGGSRPQAAKAGARKRLAQTRPAGADNNSIIRSNLTLKTVAEEARRAGAGPYPITASTLGFGIFVGEPGFPANNNLIQGNNASGNPGTGIFISVGSIGNTIRNNQALGAGSPDHDIFDANALPANTYDSNLCEISLIGPSPGPDICKLPNLAGHRNGPVDFT